MRWIALLLAVLMMTSTATPAVGTTAEAISAVDDARDLDAPVVPVPSTVAAPERREIARVAPPVPDRGRVHATAVFRPPRSPA